MAMTPWDQPLESGCPRMRVICVSMSSLRVGSIGVEERELTFMICHQIIQSSPTGHLDHDLVWKVLRANNRPSTLSDANVSVSFQPASSRTRMPFRVTAEDQPPDRIGRAKILYVQSTRWSPVARSPQIIGETTSNAMLVRPR